MEVSSYVVTQVPYASYPTCIFSRTTYTYTYMIITIKYLFYECVVSNQHVNKILQNLNSLEKVAILVSNLPHTDATLI